MNERIEIGDSVTVTFPVGGYWDWFEATVEYVPQATGDSWKLRHKNGQLVYVQLFETMVKHANQEAKS